MSSSSLISILSQLSKVDGTLARAFAEKKKLEKELIDLAAKIKKFEGEIAQKKKVFEEKRARYLHEEKLIKEEREKIGTRRRSLTNLSNYKLQQAAEREIDYSAQQLEAKEEQTLKIIEEAETAEKDYKASLELLTQQKTSYDSFSQESKENLIGLENRIAEKSTERAALASQIDAKNLSVYERVRERYPADAMVPVTKGACPGCFIQVAPQLLVEISRGSNLVKCRGCGRIVFIVETPPQQGA